MFKREGVCNTLKEAGLEAEGAVLQEEGGRRWEGLMGCYLCDSPWGAVEQQEQRAWWGPDTPRRAPRRSHQLLHTGTGIPVYGRSQRFF